MCNTIDYKGGFPMSSLKKILALFLAAIMVISLAACSAVPTSLNKEWSYKSDSQEYPVGMYIFCLYSAYRQAYSELSENLGDKFDSTASILDLSSTFDEEYGLPLQGLDKVRG